MLLARIAKPTPEDLADPWKWWTFHFTAVQSLERSAPLLIVLLLGAVAGVLLRRKFPVIGRRVAIGCATLLGVELFWVFEFWLATVLDPNPQAPLQPTPRYTLNWIFFGLTTIAKLVAVGLLVSAVLQGRMRSEGGGA